jgi:small subunit ribosomal protein S17
MPRKKNEEENIESPDQNGGNDESVVDSVVDTVTSAVGTVAGAVAGGASALVSAVTGGGDSAAAPKSGKRAERVGIVASDKMMKTVVVRVDRLVKHPTYRKYVKRRKKFMAHDELGAKTGDKVRIVETRPLSARKRWRVVEIIQKAEL